MSSLAANLLKSATRSTQLFNLSRTLLCQSKSIYFVRARSNTMIIQRRPCSVFSKSPEYSHVAQMDLTKFESECKRTLESLTEYFDEIVENEANLVGSDVAYSVSSRLKVFSSTIIHNIHFRTAYWRWNLARHTARMWSTDKRRIDKFGLVHQPPARSAMTSSMASGSTSTMACHFTSYCSASSSRFSRIVASTSSTCHSS